MWKNHPVVCQAIPTRTLAGPRSGNDLKSILEKYGQQESAYQEKQGATCTPFEIIDIEGNKVGTMTMSSIFNGPQGSINIKIYTTWTVVGGTLLITTIQAPIQESHNYDFKAAKKYLYDSYKQFKKFSSRSEFERFLKPL
jgi:hypothetical protein